MKIKNKLFYLVTLSIAASFLFTSISYALTITGSETIETNSSAVYTAEGCNGTATWRATGVGASINQSGAITTGATACGAISITAKCSDGNIATHDVRITNAGQWMGLSICYNTYWGGGDVNTPPWTFAGRYAYRADWMGYYGPCEIIGTIYPPSVCHAEGIWPHPVEGFWKDVLSDPSNPDQCHAVYLTCLQVFEWQCFPCTNGQTHACYTGTLETKGVGICKEGVGICKEGIQTCTNKQWEPCEGEVLPQPEICGDGVDNDCDGQVDEECEKILSYVSGNGQSGLICETLKNPFVVAVSGASQNSANVNWQITNMPSGATGGSISNQITTMAGSDLQSSAYLKLGDLPGGYTTEAKCGECTKGSPQIFTATAKCPEVPVYYQNDYFQEAYDNICKFIDNTKKPPVTTKVTTCQFDAKTGKLLPGYTQWTIKDKGCALTSIAMVIGQYGMQYAPDALNKTVGYTSKGEVLWRAVESMTGQSGEKLKYIFDQTHFGNIAKKINIQKSLMDKYLDKCIPVIAKVFNQITNNPHWIVVTGQKGTDYTINDPANRFSLLSQYGDIYDIRVYKNQKGGCQ